MPKITVLLEHNEDELDADHALQKALEFHSSGDAHDQDAFDDPAMVDLSNRLEQTHSKIYGEMIREIIGVLDEEYSDDVL